MHDTWHWPDLLAAARAADARPEAAYAQLATRRRSGWPACRTVVVRAVLADGTVVITADSRSAKFRTDDDTAVHRAELCWYFPATREQFRLAGHLTAIVGEPADPAIAELRLKTWRERTESSRQSFTWPDPGETFAAPEAFTQPAPAEPPATFALLLLRPLAVDYLDLRTPPHTRVRFVDDDGAWEAERVNP